MKTILVPIDFSPISLNALAYAVELAKIIHAKITAFNSYSFSTSPELFASMKDATTNEIFSKETDMLDLLKEAITPFVEETYYVNGNPIQITYKLEEGEVAGNIVREAELKGYDYIIMGTKGATGLKKVFWGSVTSEVVHATKTPVWVIPENIKYEKIDKILYASDLSYGDRNCLDHLLGLSKNFDATTTFLHINIDYLNVNTEEFAFERLEKKYKDENVIFKFQEGFDVEEEVNKYINENNIKLLAVLPKEKSMLQEIFSKSISQSLTMNSVVPLLVFQD